MRYKTAWHLPAVFLCGEKKKTLKKIALKDFSKKAFCEANSACKFPAIVLSFCKCFVYQQKFLSIIFFAFLQDFFDTTPLHLLFKGVECASLRGWFLNPLSADSKALRTTQKGGFSKPPFVLRKTRRPDAKFPLKQFFGHTAEKCVFRKFAKSRKPKGQAAMRPGL